MATTKETIQYAVFAKRDDGRWVKLNAFFYDKSIKLAEMRIKEHKESWEGRFITEYKIMKRKQTIITEDWSDV
jgi:hypothetical protein